ncbi:MAG: HD domain-containing protein [Crocinitomicaceae bacterium]
MNSDSLQNNKKKIVNDPVYGFISIPNETIFDIIQHPYFQRLRRIKQLGLTHLVYPGALHTRFQHALGAMSLMDKAITSLKRKGVEITNEEENAVLIAILLHDIGHGPFSHTLEHSIISGISHEEISVAFMERFKLIFGDVIQGALEVFKGNYHKPFLHQLVSSQLDMDRMDYLNRDSYFTGVSEGAIGSDRIIEMLNVRDGNLVVEEKGIYSVEKFITSRRLMYWQVYMHKTVVSAELMMINALKRAKELIQGGETLFATPALSYFLNHTVSKEQFLKDPEVLDCFALLDDVDIIASLKVWASHPDKILSTLSKGIIYRKLMKVEISKVPFSKERIASEEEKVKKMLNLTNHEATFFVFSDILTNNAYNSEKENINLLFKSGQVVDLSEASDNLNISALAKPVNKYALFYPRENLNKV